MDQFAHWKVEFLKFLPKTAQAQEAFRLVSYSLAAAATQPFVFTAEQGLPNRLLLRLWVACMCGLIEELVTRYL